MTSDIELFHETELDPHELYRSLSKAAVVAVVLAALSVFGIAFVPLLVLPPAAILAGAAALLNIRRYPDELSGKVLALVAIAAATVLFAAGVARHTYAYVTEVPEGYQRVSFADLQPVEDHPELPFSPLAKELDGKRIFIKGYVHPGVSGQRNIKHFVLVRDMGTCCFGGQPKLTDMIEVTLRDPYRIQYSMRRRKLAGVLRITTQRRLVSGGLRGGYFQLDAEYVK